VYGVVHNFYKADLPLLPGEFWINVFRNSDMVTGAGMAIRSSIFKEVGGFDEQFAIDFNDVDFCLRVTQTGRRNIYNPYSTILHFEGATVLRDQPNKAELEAFKARWSVYAQNYSINSIFWR
jgi:GT2 family glycosyltransferase